MTLSVLTEGFTFTKDFGIDRENNEELRPTAVQALDAMAYLISRVYSDREVKEALKEVAQRY